MKGINNMRSKDIKKFRMNMGKFLHTFFIKFGEEKYNKFVEQMGDMMIKEYGEPFSSDNLRIMEAEYVTFNSKLNGKDKEDITE